MRHRKSGRKLGRASSHRKALFSNLVASLVTYGRIETTEAKAKELRSIADRTIHWSVSVSELLSKAPDQLSRDELARLTHARRMARRVLKNTVALDKLFADVGPQLAGRPGGYTRVLKTRSRRGDAAPMAFIELVSGRASV
jgi:large subunit ribosomal protein L17